MHDGDLGDYYPGGMRSVSRTPPLDLAAVAADDAMLDAVGAGHAPNWAGGLTGLLAGWRAECEARPIPELVDVATAQTALSAGQRTGDVNPSGALRGALLAFALLGLALVFMLLAGCSVPTDAPSYPPAPSGASLPLSAIPPEEMHALITPVGDGGPKVIVGATAHVTGTYPTSCVRGPSGDARLPVMSCTPGSVRADITDDTKLATICNPHWSTSTIRAPQSETDPLKTAAMRAYGVPASVRATTELDHDVPLELGGSNDVSNLWPERSDLPGQGFRNSKDNVESRLHAAVCGHIPGMLPVPLRDAQVAIARNWTTALVVLHIPAVK
jgi:hypothetical protein